MNSEQLEKWSALEAEVERRGGDGKEVVRAMKEHYALYTDELYLWLAGLYDSSVGGWYYSNSGRDNEPFLPDIESTEQATNLMLGSGLIKDTDELPEKMRGQIIAFTKSLLDPEDGYIYHPQWGKGINDIRRGRDLTWAIQLAKQYRFALPYPTALERLAESAGTEEQKQNAVIPEHLRSKEAFVEYLDRCDWENDAYFSGSQLVAQMNQVVAAGLLDAAVSYLNAKQHKDTGLWGAKGGYSAINALLKISDFYTGTGSVFPNASRAAMSAIECLTSDEICGTTCYQYNAWSALTHLLTNLRKFGGESGAAEAEKIDLILIKNAPDTIRATTAKTATFKKADGGFSYLPHCSTGFSQKSPVSIHQTVESDVNATVLSTTGITRNMYNALGLIDFMVPIYGKEDTEKLLDALKY